MKQMTLMTACLWITLLGYGPAVADAQTQNNDFTLGELKAPSSPAFTILGVQPSEISRPKTYRAVETEFLSNFVGNDNSFILPDNYALEISPYWLFSHPNMNIREYAQPKPAESVLRSFSLSFSTNKESISDTLNLENMGFGGRFNLDFRTIDETRFEELYEELDVVQTPIVLFRTFVLTEVQPNIDTYATKQALLDSVAKAGRAFIAGAGGGNAEYEAYLSLGLDELLDYLDETGFSESKAAFGDGEETDALLDTISGTIRDAAALKDRARELSNVIRDKYGLSFEIAFAAKYTLSNNELLAKSDIKKYGVWITPSFTFKDLPYLEFLGVARYIENDTQDPASLDINDLQNLEPDNFSRNLDYGFRLVLTSPEKVKRIPFALSFELLGRKQWIDLEEQNVGNATLTRTISQHDSRFSFSFEYRLSDNLNFTYSIGKRFDKNTTNEESIFSQAGLSFGIGGKKASDFPGFNR